MKRYTVELAFHRVIIKNIIAENEQDAIEEAFDRAEIDLDYDDCIATDDHEGEPV
jgi:hypothetical protein